MLVLIGLALIFAFGVMISVAQERADVLKEGGENEKNW